MGLFNRRSAKLEIKNRLLIEVDKKRSERVALLEQQLYDLAAEKASLSIETDKYGAERVALLEQQLDDLTAEKASLSASVRSLSASVRALEESIHARATILTAERDFYFKQTKELEERIDQLTDAATRYSLWAQELDRLLGATAMKETERKLAWSTHVEQLGVKFRPPK